MDGRVNEVMRIIFAIDAVRSYVFVEQQDHVHLFYLNVGHELANFLRNKADAAEHLRQMRHRFDCWMLAARLEGRRFLR